MTLIFSRLGKWIEVAKYQVEILHKWLLDYLFIYFKFDDIMMDMVLV